MCILPGRKCQLRVDLASRQCHAEIVGVPEEVLVGLVDVSCVILAQEKHWTSSTIHDSVS